MTKLEEKEINKQVMLENMPMLVYVGTLLSIAVVLYLWLIGVI